MSSDKLKEFFWSSATTFIATFLITVAPMIADAPMDTAFWVALVVTGARAGVKAVMQYVMSGQLGEILGAKGRV